MAAGLAKGRESNERGDGKMGSDLGPQATSRRNAARAGRKDGFDRCMVLSHDGTRGILAPPKCTLGRTDATGLANHEPCALCARFMYDCPI